MNNVLMPDLKVLRDIVIMRRLPKPEQSESGLFIADYDKEHKYDYAQVVGVGPGRLTPSGERITPSVKIGDKVFFDGTYTGMEVKIDGENLVSILDKDILAIVD